MNSPVEERKLDQVTILISSSVDDVSRKGCLAADLYHCQTEVEVERLNVLKSGKMKELVFKKQNEPEEVYRGAHMDVDSDAARQILISLIESGFNQNCSCVPCNVNSPEFHKTILFVMVASGFWSLDDNRYGAGRGAHKNLKRAEKALILASKTPCELLCLENCAGTCKLEYFCCLAVVEDLSSIVKAWEMERNIHFLCDKVIHELLFAVWCKEYTVLRQEREEEKRRSREKKRLQEQFAAEQDTLYGSRSAIKKPLGLSTGANTMLGCWLQLAIPLVNGRKSVRQSTE
ncbi:hypothetical protein POTOM_003828 [Populus tomentosa]|uniref:Uncharacterized protein n=1 Tax=Populus tomentosa TaxID=118781 RepID=A0A8X8ADX5_POPTO|nr:hypothetical protein POTOM_003828 [Populus tomentosa]